jgi:nitrate/nitrite transport system permease protein
MNHNSTEIIKPPLLRWLHSQSLEQLVRRGLMFPGIPLLSLVVFVGLWSMIAGKIEVSFGSLPGPREVVIESKNLWADHKGERERRRQFYERQAERKTAFLAENPEGQWTERKYSGRPTYLDQIVTSLKTVFTGFLIASLVAVPLGILCGLSRPFNIALNPFVQVFKPVSPLASELLISPSG